MLDDCYIKKHFSYPYLIWITVVYLTLPAFFSLLFSKCECGKKYDVLKIAGAILDLVLP